MMPAHPLTPEGETGPERRCLASGRVAPKSSLVRLVVGPDGKVVPDLDAKLPGRGHYLAPERAVVERAEAKGLIRRATGGEVEPGLVGRLEALMVRRLVDRVALARKAGRAVAGFEKVREHLKAGGTDGAVLLEASDGAADGRAKLVPLAPGASVEVRIPPFVAVQCISGPKHTRGTPPTVTETDPRTWLLLVTGRKTFDEAVAEGLLRLSGARAGAISAWFPLVSLRQVGDL